MPRLLALLLAVMMLTAGCGDGATEAAARTTPDQPSTTATGAR